MLSEETLSKTISNYILNNLLDKNNVNLTLHRGQTPFSEEGQAILSMSLDKIADVLRLSNAKFKVNTDVELTDPPVSKIVNGKPFPILIIEIN